MTMKFAGTLPALRKLLRRQDINGSWEQQPNGVHMLRCPDGAILHWANGRKRSGSVASLEAGDR